MECHRLKNGALVIVGVVSLLVAGCGVKGPAVEKLGRTTDGAGTPGVPVRRASEFRPSVHGFRFRNSFTGSPLPPALAAVVPGSAIPARFGLCGGMSSAAADLYLSGTPPPPDVAAPAPDTPAYAWLVGRQIDSLGGGGLMVGMFARWMTLEDANAGGTRSLSVAELAGIVDALGQERLALVGLVLQRAGDPAARLWQNHQVLAYAARSGPDGATELLIYDPNFPGRDDVTLRCTPGTEPDGTSGLRIERSVPGVSVLPVRGFFVMPYAPAHPPEKPRG